MDETKETQQDKPSAGNEGTTSTKTFTEEEIEKRVSDRLAAKGREVKSLETREQALKAQEDANKAASLDLERQRLEAQRKELEAVADDPDRKNVLLRSYDLDKREREIADKAKQNEAAIQRMFSDAETLAIEYNLKPSDLLVAANPEAMKLLAKNLALERELEATKTKASPETTDYKPDSGLTDAAPTDFKQLRNNFISDPWKYGKAYKEALAKRGQ